MTEGDREFEKHFPGKTALEVFPMDKRATACPRCGLEFKTLLHPFCKHSYCPPRELGRRASAIEAAAAGETRFGSTEGESAAPAAGDAHV